MSTQSPLTERILTRLGRPRTLWAVLWGLMPLGILSVAWALARTLTGVTWGEFAGPRVPGFVLWAYAQTSVLLGFPFYIRLLRDIRPLVDRLSGLQEEDASRPFQGVGSVWIPVILALVPSVIYLGPDYVRYGPGLVAPLLPLYFVANIPGATALWFVVTIFLGLHRLGGMPLHLESFAVDRSLGLRPFGRLAFWAFAPLPVLVVPLLFFGQSLFDFAWNLAALAAGVALFFLSLVRLRGQLLQAKARELAWARRLYAQALAPVHAPAQAQTGHPQTNPDPPLRVQSAELLAAAEVERRAAAIQEWPFDEGTLRTFAAIMTSVAAALIARLLLSRLGL